MTGSSSWWARYASGATGALMWWPGLSLLWCAGTQHVRAVDLTGLALGLLVLGVTDVLIQPRVPGPIANQPLPNVSDQLAA